MRQPSCIRAVPVWHIDHHHHPHLSARSDPRKPPMRPSLTRIARRPRLACDLHPRSRRIVRHSICNRSLQPLTHYRLSIEIPSQPEVRPGQLRRNHLHVLEAQHQELQLRLTARRSNLTRRLISNQTRTAPQPIRPQHIRRLLRCKPRRQTRKPCIARVGECAFSVQYIHVSRMRAGQVAARDTKIPVTNHGRLGANPSLSQSIRQK